MPKIRQLNEGDLAYFRQRICSCLECGSLVLARWDFRTASWSVEDIGQVQLPYVIEVVGLAAVLGQGVGQTGVFFHLCPPISPLELVEVEVDLELEVAR